MENEATDGADKGGCNADKPINTTPSATSKPTFPGSGPSSAMDKFKRGLIECGRQWRHRLPSMEEKRQFDDNFQAMLSRLRTPNHHTYAEMIMRAITGLDEEGGSSEASISSFIQKENHDVPFAHSRLLTHHLNKLTERGEIIRTPDSCYLLPNPDSNLEPNPNPNTNRDAEKHEKRNQQLRRRKFVIRRGKDGKSEVA